MTKSVALCVSEAMRSDPDSLGLPGEHFETQPWLRVFTSGEEVRRWIRNEPDVEESWVVATEDVAAINLAAALKADCPAMPVRLVSDDAGSGSLATRAMAADVDTVWGYRHFADAYRGRKQASGNLATQPIYPEKNASSGFQGLVTLSESTFASPISLESEQGACYQPARRAFVLSVISGSGGAGKSTVSALSALLLQRYGNKTLLLDSDLQFGDVADLLEGAQVVRLEEAIDDPVAFKNLQASPGMPVVVSAPAKLEDAEELSPELAALIDRAMSDFDAIVINTGAFWAEHHAVILEKSSKTLFLIDQRSSSLRACRRALDLCERCGMATTPFLFVVNRCSKKALFSSIDVSCALQGSECVELLEGGPEVEELLGSGMADELLESKNRLCSSLDSALLSLLPPALLPKAGKEARLARKAAKRKRFAAKRGHYDESA